MHTAHIILFPQTGDCHRHPYILRSEISHYLEAKCRLCIFSSWLVPSHSVSNLHLHAARSSHVNKASWEHRVASQLERMAAGQKSTRSLQKPWVVRFLVLLRCAITTIYVMEHVEPLKNTATTFSGKRWWDTVRLGAVIRWSTVASAWDMLTHLLLQLKQWVVQPTWKLSKKRVLVYAVEVSSALYLWQTLRIVLRIIAHALCMPCRMYMYAHA